MDPINYFIVILLIIGILLLLKNYIKEKTKEAFGVEVLKSIGVIDNDDDDNKTDKYKQPSTTAGYEDVGSAGPPLYKDKDKDNVATGIYDFNLKYAKQVWEDMGCNPQSKYAPNVDNKEDLFGKVGWAREDYPFRVKSMQVEANKAEYNYYDWGKYKDETDDVPGNTSNDANKWEMNDISMNSNWKETINRPSIVKFPMGIRKSRALCNGEDPGDYNLPKLGDKVKIKNKVLYDSPYFAGIVVGKDGKDDDKKNIDVLWYQKGTGTVDETTNKITNSFSDVDCGINIDKLDKCTRTETENEEIEVTIDINSKENPNSIGWKLYGTDGTNGQRSWFGSPNLSIYNGEGGDKLDAIDYGGKKWKDRYNVQPYYGKTHIVPDNLLNYDDGAKTDTFIESGNGSIDPKSVFKIKECKSDSACEDLRCNSIVDNIKKKYPLTHVCKVDKRNTYGTTRGQYCKSGINKGSTFTYYSNPPCAFQDYGKDDYHPQIFCKDYCAGNCKNINELDNWIGTNYVEVWCEKDFKGQKAIVRLQDLSMEASRLFPTEPDPHIKSMKIHGTGTVVLLASQEQALDYKFSDNDNFIYIEGANTKKISDIDTLKNKVRKGFKKYPNQYIEGSAPKKWLKSMEKDDSGCNGCHQLVNVSLMHCKDTCMLIGDECKSFDWERSTKTCWFNDKEFSNGVKIDEPKEDIYEKTKGVVNLKKITHIEVCKLDKIKIPEMKISIPNDPGSEVKIFQGIDVGGLKIKYLRICSTNDEPSMFYGDQNSSNVTTCNIRGIHTNGGSTEIGKITNSGFEVFQNRYNFVGAKAGNLTNSGKDGQRSGDGTLGSYGKELKKIKGDGKWKTIQNEKKSILVKDEETHDDLRCDTALPYLPFALPITGVICIALKIKMAILGEEIDNLEQKVKDEEKTRPPIPDNLMMIPNSERIYKLSGKTPISEVQFYPSWIGDGHESYYKVESNGLLFVFSK